MAQTFYMRHLPKQLIAFSSSKGKEIFVESLQARNMNNYFPLAEQFLTQYLPSTCGTSSLVMALNALKLDPNNIWKGAWRWFSEENISGVTQSILNKGVNLQTLNHLAQKNGASSIYFYPKNQYEFNVPSKKSYDCNDNCEIVENILRSDYNTFFLCILACSRREGFFMIVNSNRATLEQTGDGHFSPICGYSQSTDMTLVFDVARFKYPPYWCNVKTLFKSMENIDIDTQKPRGFMLISRGLQFSSLCRINPDEVSEKSIKAIYSGRNNQVADIFFSQFDLDARVCLVFYLFDLNVRFQNRDKDFKQIRDILENQMNKELEEIKKLENNNSILVKRVCDDFLKTYSSVAMLLLLARNNKKNYKELINLQILKEEFKQLDLILGITSI